MFTNKLNSQKTMDLSVPLFIESSCHKGTCNITFLYTVI